MVLRKVWACGLALTTGCASVHPQVPPADAVAPIAQEVPSLPEPLSAPAPGMGLVVLDSVSGPAKATWVEARGTSDYVTMGEYGGRGTEHWVIERPLCSSTPCAAYMPFGEQEVSLVSAEDPRRTGAFRVSVTEKPRILRASLDATVPADHWYTLGALGMAGGIGLLLGAAYLWAVPLGPDGTVAPEQRVASASLMVSSVVVGVIGALLFLKGHGQKRYDERGIEWTIGEASSGGASAH